MEWKTLHGEKKEAFVDLVEKQKSVSLMPGVDELLKSLQSKDKPRCVVTNR
jgi:beta-phosphoglucomutase-like phosphatase (HAD superfamily)